MSKVSKEYFSKNFIERLSFPRLSDTNGEKKAQELIETELNTLGIKDHRKESFFYTKFFMNVLLRVYNPLIGLLIFFIILFITFNLFFLSFFLSILLFFLSYFGRQIRERIQFTFTNIGKKRESYNYVINIPAINKNPKTPIKTIVILAHYDSISHKLHPLFAGAIHLFTLIGGTIVSLHALIVIIFYSFDLIPLIDGIQFIYGIFLAGFYMIQLFNTRGNESLGTADNATGVASALYVINKFNKKPLKSTRLLVVLTGAEETGDYGADSYIKAHFRELDTLNTLFLIFDSVGANSKTNLFSYGQGLIPKKNFSPKMESVIFKMLKEDKLKNYRIKPFWVPPLIHYSTDHAPLKPHGYEFLIFFSNAPIHSKKDNLQNYFPEMLNNFNEFITNVIIKLDKTQL